ncbi:MAG TPA: hypothetical protein VGT08_12015 [Terracidiphilus sp.]|nr:hypothetical protein [Terracidiphilus sp.]
MKSAALVLFALLFGSIPLASQNASQGQPSYGVARMELLNTAAPPITIGCPVSLRAQHRADGGLLNVGKSRSEGIAQMLHLILTNPDARRMVAALVRVHGLSGKARVTQTRSGSDQPDAVATLNVQLTQGLGKEVNGDLRVPNMTAVLSIDLNSVTLADGSTWNFTGRDACHVVPDKLMLIAGH